jgi:hypothetical protein
VNRFVHDLHRSYEEHIVHPGKEQAFWILVSFLLTFVIVRTITHTIRAGRGPFRDISIGGAHLHHLVPGIALLLITGYLSNALHLRQARTVVALFFGVGAALTLDEFALWLHLKDVYWTEQGRRSIDVVVICATVAGLVVLGLGFWRDLARVMGRDV